VISDPTLSPGSVVFNKGGVPVELVNLDKSVRPAVRRDFGVYAFREAGFPKPLPERPK
jgi:hypothetical protein